MVYYKDFSFQIWEHVLDSNNIVIDIVSYFYVLLSGILSAFYVILISNDLLKLKIGVRVSSDIIR